MTYNPATAYRQHSVGSATPIGLVILLYEAALASLYRAREALQEKNVEKRTRELNHVLEVIGELHGSLNVEEGGKVARRLSRYYEIARNKIMEASLAESDEILEGLTRQFTSLRDTWKQVEQSATAGATVLPSSPSPAPAKETQETAEAAPASRPAPGQAALAQQRAVSAMMNFTEAESAASTWSA